MIFTFLAFLISAPEVTATDGPGMTTTHAPGVPTTDGKFGINVT